MHYRIRNDTGSQSSVKVAPSGESITFLWSVIEAPLSRNYRMDNYVTKELRLLVMDEFGADPGRLGIFGHYKGGMAR